MPSNANFDSGKFEEFQQIDELKKSFQKARDRFFAGFKSYLASQQQKRGLANRPLEVLLDCEDGRKEFAQIHSSYFYTLRVRDDEWPMLGYAEGIRSHIKNQIIKDFNIDISNLENFPNTESNWKKYTVKLTQEGKAFTKHKEDIPPNTIDKIYMLLVRVQSALENRHSDNYVEEYLAKIPTDLHNKLPRVMMFGGCFLVIFFEVRRGQEGLCKSDVDILPPQLGETPWPINILPCLSLMV